jgi:hypothetical protein
VLALAFLIAELTLAKAGDLQSLFAFGESFGAQAPWWSLGVVVLELGAGVALVRRSPHARVLATVFGVAGAAVELVLAWPVVQDLREMHGLLDPQDAVAIAPRALAVVIPLATLALAHRAIAPTARARYRS